MYVCLCNAITESEVRKAGQEGVVVADDLIRRFDLDNEDCCGYCIKHIDFFVEIAEGEDAMTYVRYRAHHPGIPGRH